MGKKSDKMYITHSEWSNEFEGGMSFGGCKVRKQKQNFKRLPFDCCALSLQPFEHPMCTPDGTIFELMNIVPWLKKYGTSPITGEKLSAKSLIKLNFAKNANGKYHCPVSFKEFTDNTKIAAIKTTGNVYEYDIIEKLNIKPKYWKDLLTDEPFTRKDIIILQDPQNLDNKNYANFYHYKKGIKAPNQNGEDDHDNINSNEATERVLNKVKKSKETVGNSSSSNSLIASKAKKAYNAAPYSQGKVSASFTSTALSIETKNEYALFDDEEYMFKHIKDKGYCSIKTNYGDLNLELNCKAAPRTCYNFIMLSKKGYYKNVIFHRSIKHFMIQGGDPTGTGRGGESIWKKEFPDEFKSNLSHKGRGVLSMANHGKNTNGSQFFITYRSCTHLDNKHTIFGKLVGGLEVLSKLEAIPTDDQDRPLQEIKIKDVVVYVDPYEKFQEELKSKEEQKKEEEEKEKKKIENASKFKTTKTGIGKYLPDMSKRKETEDNEEHYNDYERLIKKQKTKGKSGFGDFSSW
ncbi:peptidyl-prolyl cis-trans isomerase-like 2-like protein [Neocallimastix lanati (nom. inval.)]|jgi:peptidyl-prolyl cis-trans isomerase-like protein 2|uniref:Peptidyl-prolyl cis-trans isomerase-like 2-like protein n=1 Tax=Neocallimastix californiae TaxID=1754190 RepID=A0A1Y2AZH7_9FUNG|nr:peptidyl-prolyl cis-trans isomerase-like 2-like protein [Neocallimastix sp. JGI-2020a]ORY27963.1 peptidyl-prolyl cis-trans isomerase-like 2-like protein [Neocallimastix californiae]|eukprot:ORY27963.1 peptidyl-prolyl cis-trans isomerase-like 2-like protein [Neocallimastix californiae]